MLFIISIFKVGNFNFLELLILSFIKAILLSEQKFSIFTLFPIQKCTSSKDEIRINQFTYITKVGINTLQLDFDQIKYHFTFTQYGAGFDGEEFNFLLE